MNTVTAVRDRILQLCAERGISINRLASLSALPPSSLKNILYGKSQNPKILTIKLLCDGLGITLGEFFSTPEFDALEQEPFRQVCARFLSALQPREHAGKLLKELLGNVRLPFGKRKQK